MKVAAVPPSPDANTYFRYQRVLGVNVNIFDCHCIFFFQDCELGGLKDMADDLKEEPKNPEGNLKQASVRYQSFSTSHPVPVSIGTSLTSIHPFWTLIGSTVNCHKMSTGSDIRSASLT